ncbi:hypothetical protein YC2023_012567 [Brassica napus]
MAFCSLPTTGSLDVFNQALMRTMSSVGDHLRLALRSETVCSSSAHCVPKTEASDEEKSTLASRGT